MDKEQKNSEAPFTGNEEKSTGMKKDTSAVEAKMEQMSELKTMEEHGKDAESEIIKRTKEEAILLKKGSIVKFWPAPTDQELAGIGYAGLPYQAEVLKAVENPERQNLICLDLIINHNRGYAIRTSVTIHGHPHWST